MITKAVVDVFLSALDALFSLLPSWSFSPDSTAAGPLAWAVRANHVFPVFTLLTVLGLWVGLLVLLRTWDFGVFVYHQFWGSS